MHILSNIMDILPNASYFLILVEYGIVWNLEMGMTHR